MGWFRRRSADESGNMVSVEERLAQIGPGVPGHCPACDGLGYIDDIDIGHRFQIQHCKDCQHRWEYLFDSDGKVVGLTELPVDDHDDAQDVVVDLRDQVVAQAEVREPAEATELSPADWLRRSLDR